MQNTHYNVIPPIHRRFVEFNNSITRVAHNITKTNKI